jgi:hypothetical protein
VRKFIGLVIVLTLAYLLHVRSGTARVEARAAAADGVVASRPVAPGQVSGSGTVIRILTDDDEGDRHQRFLLRLQSGATLLVAHNIDVAPRVEPLHVGDTVEYAGEFAWNPKGGVVHWTHHDPSGRHPDGWLRHDGHTFQ